MKNILALILALLMMMTVFVGCGNDVEVYVNPADDVVVNDEVSDDADDEAVYDACVRIDAMCDNEYNYYNLSAKCEGLEEVTSSIDAGCETKGGQTVGELLDDCGYTEIAFAEDYEGFLGWAVYDMDEDGVKKSDDEKLYTTDEMLEYVMNKEMICFVAKWENTSEQTYEMFGY